MTKDQAREQLSRVSQARQQNKSDEELQARLKDEFSLLLERLKRTDS